MPRRRTRHGPYFIPKAPERAAMLAELSPLGPEAQTALIMMMLFVLMAGGELKKRPEYRCPSCGTSRAKEHGEECAWRKHYGEDL